MRKFVKMLVGIGLWPLAAAVSVSTYRLYESSIQTSLDGGWEAWSLPIGFILWIVVFLLLPRPFRTYVLGHELTHALWALMMGARVGRMKVGKSGGHVELSKTNFVIALSPYFFPFYTALVIGAYHLCGIWMDVQADRTWWLAAAGLTWSFHATFTIHMLSEHQPDVQEHGRIFSLTVIYIMNVFVIALLMALLGEPRLQEFGRLLQDETSASYNHAYSLLQQAFSLCIQLAGKTGRATG